MWANFTRDASYNTNFNYSFSSNQASLTVHLSQWQYWFWFWFITLWSLYFFIALKVSQRKNKNYNATINTSLRGHGRWGDFLVATIPSLWCWSILSNANHLMRLVEWQAEGSLFTVRIIGNQWWWSYYYSPNIAYNLRNYYINIGNNNWMLKTPRSTEFSQFWARKWKRVTLYNRLIENESYLFDKKLAFIKAKSYRLNINKSNTLNNEIIPLNVLNSGLEFGDSFNLDYYKALQKNLKRSIVNSRNVFYFTGTSSYLKSIRIKLSCAFSEAYRWFHLMSVYDRKLFIDEMYNVKNLVPSCKAMRLPPELSGLNSLVLLPTYKSNLNLTSYNQNSVYVMLYERYKSNFGITPYSPNSIYVILSERWQTLINNHLRYINTLWNCPTFSEKKVSFESIANTFKFFSPEKDLNSLNKEYFYYIYNPLLSLSFFKFLHFKANFDLSMGRELSYRVYENVNNCNRTQSIFITIPVRLLRSTLSPATFEARPANSQKVPFSLFTLKFNSIINQIDTLTDDMWVTSKFKKSNYNDTPRAWCFHQERISPRTRIAGPEFVDKRYHINYESWSGRVWEKPLHNSFIKKITFSDNTSIQKVFPINNSAREDIYNSIKRFKRKTEYVPLTLTRRLAKVNRALVLPIHVNITVITSSHDVIHSWFIPGLGIKMDCVPGRATHHTLYIERAGIYYGQCAEICGRYHHHMPIRICAIPFEHFLIWWKHYGLRVIRKKVYLESKLGKNILSNKKKTLSYGDFKA